MPPQLPAQPSQRLGALMQALGEAYLGSVPSVLCGAAGLGATPLRALCACRSRSCRQGLQSAIAPPLFQPHAQSRRQMRGAEAHLCRLELALEAEPSPLGAVLARPPSRQAAQPQVQREAHQLFVGKKRHLYPLGLSACLSLECHPLPCGQQQSVSQIPWTPRPRQSAPGRNLKPQLEQSAPTWPYYLVGPQLETLVQSFHLPCQTRDPVGQASLRP